MNIKKFISNRMVQYGVLSVFIGITNFFMIASLYVNQVLRLNAILFAPLFVLSIFALAYLIVEKTGFIRDYFHAQHSRSPVLNEILQTQKQILREVRVIKKMAKK